jgi:C1A family cysteine protease
VYHVQELQILGAKDLEAIKQAVYECGGVQSACYMPQTAGAEREQYYREETCAFYYNGAQEPNHDVVIVGWDDYYPKENFPEQPEGDGAFLCQNSWGEYFGEGGYFSFLT